VQLEGIDHVALSVRDIDRSLRWYSEVLGFKREHDDVWDDVPTFIALGTTAIALFPIHGGSSKKNASPGRTIAEVRMLHLAFRADRKNFLSAQEELEKRGIKFNFQDHEISHSIYFCDPDGHELEITTYELR
jgi:catechol 2,3-dioxygenase-like lactoylglutathione lyase family enzyme